MFKFISNAAIKWLTHEHDVKGYPKCDFERIRYELRPCDVLLIEGRSRISETIKGVTQSSWSHSSLYLGRLHDIENEETRELASKFYNDNPSEQLVLEGVMGKGTIISPLSIYKKDHIRICRPHGLSPVDAQKVLQYAISKLGTKYDVRQTVDLAMFILYSSLLPKKWLSNLFSQNAGEPVKTICSTVIAEAFHSVEFPILPYVKKHSEKGIELIPRNPRLFTPSDFDYSPYFEIIKYPFLEFNNHAMYRHLPWNRDGELSHDEHLKNTSENIFDETKEALESRVQNIQPNSDKQSETIEENILNENTDEEQPYDTSNDERTLNSYSKTFAKFRKEPPTEPEKNPLGTGDNNSSKKKLKMILWKKIIPQKKIKSDI